MKASELASELLQEIQANGGDFEVAVAYWTEMDVKNAFECKTKEDTLAMLQHIEDVLNSDDVNGWL